MEFYWGSHTGHERLVFEFKDEIDLNYEVSRTGKQELTLELPGSAVKDIEMPSGRVLSGSRLIEGVDVEGNRLHIKANTNAFGYISYNLPHENKIVIDIFRDPLGAQWEPDSGIEPAAPQPQDEADLTPVPVPEVQEEDPEISPSEPAAMSAHRLRAPIQRDQVSDMSHVDPDISQVEQVAEAGSSRVIQRIQRDEPQDIQPDQPLPGPEEVIEDETVEEDAEPQVVVQPDFDEPADEPGDYEDLIFAARAMMSGGDFRGAVNILEGLINDPGLPDQYLEEVLYTHAEANFQRFRHDLRNNFTQVIAPFERAVNYDPNSERLPDALLSLGYIHLQVGNEPEARGYFNLLRDKYPEDPAVPSTYYYWGDYYSRQGEFQEAADNFEKIVQDFPEDQLVRPAAINLARALSELDFHRDALDILEFIESRWPRNYIDDPDFLILAGYILYRNDRLDDARNRFLHYINLIPDGDQVAVSMARIGDIYLLQGNKQAAKDMHEQTVRMYPDEEGGLIAAMRLAEEGIYDDPQISDFDRTFSMRPRAIYKRISDEFPDSPLAPVALLKLAMWDIYHGYFNYQESLDAIESFYERYSHKELWPRALDVGFEAFSSVVAQEYPESNYQEIIDTWEDYKYLNEHPEHLGNEERLALATSYWNRDRKEEALKVAGPFLQQDEIDEHNHAALSLLLSIYLDTANWQAILGLDEQVEGWDLHRDKRLQMDYARALALQNTAREDEALPLWRRLAVETDFPGSQKAFALFYLALDAFDKQDYQNTYIFAQESLAMFMEQEEPNIQRIMTCLDMLIDATSNTGRLREALGWALEYENYIDQDDPDWPATQYRLARMYRLNHQYENWEETLRGIIENFPNDMFSRMAQSDLNTMRLTREAEQYRP